MGSLEKQRIESQLRQLTDSYADTFKGTVYRVTDSSTGVREFTLEFLNQLPSDVRSLVEGLEKQLNAS